MAIQSLPGQTGAFYSRVSSMDGRAIGKFTDANHLGSLRDAYPQDYDKKIITLYSQSMLYSNDFLDMVNKSKPFYLDGASDTWKWGITKGYQPPFIVSIPASTLSQAQVGADSIPFELIINTNEFKKNAVIILGHKMYGQRIYATSEPRPAGKAYVQEFILVSPNPQNDFVSSQWLVPGTIVELSHHNIGEFDQDLGGLRRLADKLEMFESLGSGDGLEHGITAWADDKKWDGAKDTLGKPLDILFYGSKQMGSPATAQNFVKWEPFVEFMMRKQMLEQKVSKMVWGFPGTVRTNGSFQELKKESAGVYYRMKYSGNYVSYNRGEFSADILRAVFGDLFYRRVDVGQRRVKLYTNEAGYDVFQQAIKEDAFGSGLTFNVGDNDKFVQGQGQHLVYNYAFDQMVTRETGVIELVHLLELDLPATPAEFGQNKKSTPIFMVFNVSPDSNGQLTDNIREVRRAGMPNMTWGYIDGRRSHLGPMASQGHSAASKFNGYQIFMDDRYDVFIEDMSRTVLIEEIPQY
jgi:hypothetical protein